MPSMKVLLINKGNTFLFGQVEVIQNNYKGFRKLKPKNIGESYAFPSENIPDFTLMFECLNDKNFCSEWK